MVWNFDLNELPLDEDEAFQASSPGIHDGQTVTNQNPQSQAVGIASVASYPPTNSHATWDGHIAMASPSGCNTTNSSDGSLESLPTTVGIIRGIDNIGHDEDTALDSTTSSTYETLEPNPTVDSQGNNNILVVSFSSRNSDEIGHDDSDEDRALDCTSSDTRENVEPNPTIDSQGTKNEVVLLSSRNSYDIGLDEDGALDSTTSHTQENIEPDSTKESQGTKNEVVSLSSRNSDEIGHDADRALDSTTTTSDNQENLEPCPTIDSQGTKIEVVTLSSRISDKIGHGEDRTLESTISDTRENPEPNPTIDSQGIKNEVVSLSSRNSDERASNLRRNREVLAGSDEEKEYDEDKKVSRSTGSTLAKRIKKEDLETNSNFAPRTCKKSAAAAHRNAPAHRYAPAHHKVPLYGYAPAHYNARHWHCNGPPPTRSWNKYPGFVLKCNTSMKMEYCARRCILGLTASQSKIMEGIKSDTLLFLFDYELDLLNGIYIATTNAGLVFDRNGFGGGRYSTQVRFEIHKDCYPLPLKTLNDLKERSNPWRRRDFFGEGLSKSEVDHLSYLFSPRPLPPLFRHSLQPSTAADWVKIAAEKPDHNSHTSTTTTS